MVTRVCVLGNSHAACFKLAWDAARDSYRETALTFFADRAWGLIGLQPKGGMLVPASDELRTAISHTSGGQSDIDLAAYDAVLMVGLGALAYPRADSYFSSAALRQWLLDFTPRTIAVDLARKIRQISRIPVFVAHTPLETAIEPEADLDLGPYRGTIRFMNERFFNPLGTQVLEQPEQTITNGFFSKRALASGARRLDIGDDLSNQPQPSSDRRHMNSAYGELCLAAHLPKMTGATDPGSAPATGAPVTVADGT